MRTGAVRHAAESTVRETVLDSKACSSMGPRPVPKAARQERARGTSSRYGSWSIPAGGSRFQVSRLVAAVAWNRIRAPNRPLHPRRARQRGDDGKPRWNQQRPFPTRISGTRPPAARQRRRTTRKEKRTTATWRRTTMKRRRHHLHQHTRREGVMADDFRRQTTPIRSC